MDASYFTALLAAAMPPTGVSATQDETTITVNWTPPDPTPSAGYLIYYSSHELEGATSISSGSANQTFIAGWQADRVYTVSMVALSEHLPSASTLLPAVQLGIIL